MALTRPKHSAKIEDYEKVLTAEANINKMLEQAYQEDLESDSDMKDMVKVRHVVNGKGTLRKYLTEMMIIPGQENKEGKVWVYVMVEVYYKTDRNRNLRVRRKFNTGVLIYPNEWNAEKKALKSKATNAFDRNNKIRETYSEIGKKISEIISGAKDVELSDQLKILKSLFGDAIQKEKQKGKTLINFLDEYIDHRKKQGTQRGTYKEFISLKNRLLKFEEKNEALYFHDVNITLADRLKAFLAESGYHPNTISKSFDILKTFLNYYFIRKDEMKLDIPDKFKQKEFGNIKEYQQPPIALNDTEIEIIRKYNFNSYFESELAKLDKQIKKEKLQEKREFLIQNLKNKIASLELTRDRILLQIGTGLRVSDLFNIKPVNVDLKKNILRINPTKTINTKTSNQTIIPLFEMAREILTKDYCNCNTSRKPFKVSSQNYNASIKDLLEVAGIDDPVEIMEFKGFSGKAITKKKYQIISSHNFRDTFITTAIRKGYSIPVILKWTNQSSYAVMKKYINLSEEDLVKGTDMFN